MGADVHELVYLPFLLSMVVVALSRAASRRLAPRAAAWAILMSMVALGASTAVALGLLASPLVARLPLAARLGRWQPGTVALRSPVPVWLSIVALAALTAVTGCAIVRARRLASQFRGAAQAHNQLPPGSPELVVVNESKPLAYALSPTMSRSGRIIISKGMLTLLDDAERSAVLAHERAHLRHHHDLFIAASDLATAANPLLAPTRKDLRFALERWADEDAAGATSRAVTASALAKAAIAAINLITLPSGASQLHSHSMPLRVAALLDGPPSAHRRLAWLLICLAVTAGFAVALATHDTEQFFEAVRRSQ